MEKEEIRKAGISVRLGFFLKVKKLRQKNLGKILKMSQQTISSYCRTGNIPFHILHAMRSLLGLNIEWLDTGEGEMFDDTFSKNIPKQAGMPQFNSGILGEKVTTFGNPIKNEYVDVGIVEIPFWGYYDDDELMPSSEGWKGQRLSIRENMLPGKMEADDFFAINIKTDKLETCNIKNDDTIIFLHKKKIENGKIGIVRINEKNCIRRVFFSGDKTRAKSCANLNKEEVFETDNLNQIKISAVMVSIYRSELSSRTLTGR